MYQRLHGKIYNTLLQLCKQSSCWCLKTSPTWIWSNSYPVSWAAVKVTKVWVDPRWETWIAPEMKYLTMSTLKLWLPDLHMWRISIVLVQWMVDQVYLIGMLELSFLNITGPKQGNGLINIEDFYGIIWWLEVRCVKLKRRIRTVHFTLLQVIIWFYNYKKYFRRWGKTILEHSRIQIGAGQKNGCRIQKYKLQRNWC